LLDQAAAERAAGVTKMSHHGTAQMVFNLVPKGRPFRDLIALEENAIVQAPMIERLMKE
jgi:hypothetical protein